MRIKKYSDIFNSLLKMLKSEDFRAWYILSPYMLFLFIYFFLKFYKINSFAPTLPENLFKINLKAG